MSKFDDQFSLNSKSGAQLNVYASNANGKARGIVHINHGLAEHAVRYARFAEALSQSGFHVYAHDHRGHGYTKAPDAPQTVFSHGNDGVAKVLSDCAAIQAFALKQHPDLPIIMFGHSMGAQITMNYALRYPEKLAGVAVWNANFSGGILGRLAQLILLYERFRLGSDMPSRIIPRLTFEEWGKKISNHRTCFDWLSHIDSEVDAYIDDPLCGWDASVGMWLNIFEMLFFGGAPKNNASLNKLDLPYFLLGGGEDPATEFGKAVNEQAKRLSNAGFTNVKSHIFPTARHETLNDLDAQEATNQFISFAKSCCIE
ncbi:MAG: alpha/beta hydrolase [Pseudomonadota bacterium]